MQYAAKSKIANLDKKPYDNNVLLFGNASGLCDSVVSKHDVDAMWGFRVSLVELKSDK